MPRDKPNTPHPADATMRSRLYRARQNARLDRATALSAMALLKAPDAGLRLVLAELSADYARLYDDNLRLRGELAALVALIEGEP